MNSFRIFLAIVLAIIFSNVSLATSSLEEYGRLPAFSKMALSPNGDLVAFRRTSSERDMVVVFSVKEGTMISGLDVSAIDPQDIYFLNDENLILIVSQYKKLLGYREAFDISTAFSYQFRKNKIEPLLKPGESVSRKLSIHAGQSGLGRIVGVSPDSETVFMPAYLSESSYDQSPNYGVLRVRANGKGAPRALYKGVDNANDFFMDNKGNLIAREIYKENSGLHRLDRRDGKKWETIYSEKLALTTHNFVGLSADFSSIVFGIVLKENDYTTYYAMSLKDGSVTKLPYERDDADIDGLILDKNRVVIGVKYSGFIGSYKFFDPKIQKRVDAIQALFSEHAVYIQDWSKNFKDILISVEGSSAAGDYYIFSEGKKPRFVASSRPSIKEENINPIATTAYAARDGRRIPTLLTIPRDKLNNFNNLPTVIMPHGGPAAYDRLGFDFMAQALASRGFLVIQPQFRGSKGFGYEHEQAGHGEWGKKMQDDLTDAIRAFTKSGMVDANRVCIAGASYGGYAALAGAVFTPELYTCAYSLAGVSDIPEMLKADKSRFGKNSQVMSYFKMAIGGGEFDKQELVDISPYTHADKVKIPVMLVHGVDDTRVEYKQSKIMYKALKKAGVDVTLIKLKHEDHYLQDGETRLQALEALVSFVEKHIGNGSQASSL